jgi:hypothetical protein
MNLHVKIRKKYREGLLKKWTWRKNKSYASGGDCSLCMSFLNNECKRCPFKKFSTIAHAGCGRWIGLIDEDFPVFIPTKNQFDRFIKKAKRYITFY